VLLAQRAAAGSEKDLARLYRRYADPLFAFIYHRLGGHRLDAEDVFQDTWLAVLRSLPMYRGKSGLFGWLCGIALHKISDRHPCRRRDPVRLSRDIPAERLSAIMDDGPLPEDVLARLDTRIRALEALVALPDEHRLALVARYAHQCTVEETARRLGRSYKATESLLSRARKAFRDVLERTDRESCSE
jgi:RNA polymerase sigma-70 factor (ECF subfamily)